MTSRFDLITNAIGSVTVRNQQANITLDPVEYAFLGNSTVRIKIRQDSVGGPVLLESPPITIIDNAELISVTANTYSVPEGQSVLFSILTRNVPDGAVVAYVAESVTGNITANDLSIGNVSALAGGFSEIIDNIATFTVFANVDNTLGESGEQFRVSIKAGNTNGIVLGYSDNVTIKDTSEFFNIVSDKSTVNFGTNVTFTIQTFGLPDGANLFYFTAGDVTNFDSANAQANTGYVITSSNVATVTLRPIAPTNSISPFNLLIRDANTNILLASSSGVSSVGENTLFNEITGGTETTIGNYKYHVFTTSGTFTINRVGETYPELQIVAIGAGQPGGSGPGSSLQIGGGGGEVKDISYSMPQSIRYQQVSVNVANTSPTGISPATIVSFGATSGGYTISSRSATGGTSGSGLSNSPGTSQDKSIGGGGGATGLGSPRSYPSSQFYLGGTGGACYTVPWLSENNGSNTSVGTQLGTGSQFGGGGGGGALGTSPTAYQHLGGGSSCSLTGGAGGSATRILKSHQWHYTIGGVNYIENQTYNYYQTSGGTAAISYGSGGGGGSAGYTTTQYGSSTPVAQFPTVATTQPGGAGMPGAVIMRYRIAED